jgi:hypothetical protein
MKIFTLLLGLTLAAPASAQTTNPEWALSDNPHWGLAVFNGVRGGYQATGLVRFYPTRQACVRDGEAAVHRIVFGNPSCTAMYCRPYAFFTCSELDEGASGWIVQTQ